MTKQTKSDIKRQHILDTGREMILKHGFGGVGLAALLKACSVPKGSFYHYFPSKEAFGEALLQDYVATYLERVDTLFAGPATSADKLNSFWQAWLGHSGQTGIAGQCLVVKLGAEVADLSDSMREILNDGVAAFVGRIAALLEQGAQDGSLRSLTDPTATAQMLYAKWLGAAILAKLDQSQTPLQQALVDTTNLLSPPKP